MMLRVLAVLPVEAEQDGTVLVDASVIRAFVVPAFMSVAVRWNWYPGRPLVGDPRMGGG